jgi:hypothetical protein
VRKLLLCQVELTSIRVALGVPKETPLAWRRRAAETATAINHPLWRHVTVTQGQRDEMWRVIRRQHAQQATPDGESTEARTDGRQGVWVSCAPAGRLGLAAYGGPRPFHSALALIQMPAAVVRGVPCFCSDGVSR